MTKFGFKSIGAKLKNCSFRIKTVKATKNYKTLCSHSIDKISSNKLQFFLWQHHFGNLMLIWWNKSNCQYQLSSRRCNWIPLSSPLSERLIAISLKSATCNVQLLNPSFTSFKEKADSLAPFADKTDDWHHSNVSIKLLLNCKRKAHGMKHISEVAG